MSMDTDLFKEHGFRAGAVLGDLSHGVLLPQHLGFLLSGQGTNT